MLTVLLSLALFATAPKTETPAPKAKQEMVRQPMLHTRLRFYDLQRR